MQAVALLLADLGVTKTHSRPHVSNDNPFSEAQFKTLKYRPDFPERFGSTKTHARTARFFAWYNTSIVTAASASHAERVHYGPGSTSGSRRNRAGVLAAAYAAHPDRFAPAYRDRSRFRPQCGSTSRRRSPGTP